MEWCSGAQLHAVTVAKTPLSITSWTKKSQWENIHHQPAPFCKHSMSDSPWCFDVSLCHTLQCIISVAELTGKLCTAAVNLSVAEDYLLPVMLAAYTHYLSECSLTPFWAPCVLRSISAAAQKILSPELWWSDSSCCCSDDEGLQCVCLHTVTTRLVAVTSVTRHTSDHFCLHLTYSAIHINTFMTREKLLNRRKYSQELN